MNQTTELLIFCLVATNTMLLLDRIDQAGLIISIGCFGWFVLQFIPIILKPFEKKEE